MNDKAQGMTIGDNKIVISPAKKEATELATATSSAQRDDDEHTKCTIKSLSANSESGQKVVEEKEKSDLSATASKQQQVEREITCQDSESSSSASRLTQEAAHNLSPIEISNNNNAISSRANSSSSSSTAAAITYNRPQKYCAVCGDKAIACNFNAVTCESCKAFFRRNAFKEQRLRCLFEKHCVIDRVTRRFCSKCRLLKCFAIGMKREWILTDEQKQIKRVKILQNKRSRDGSTSQLHRETSSSAATVAAAATTQVEGAGTTYIENNNCQVGPETPPLSSGALADYQQQQRATAGSVDVTQEPMAVAAVATAATGRQHSKRRLASVDNQPPAKFVAVPVPEKRDAATNCPDELELSSIGGGGGGNSQAALFSCTFAQPHQCHYCTPELAQQQQQQQQQHQQQAQARNYRLAQNHLPASSYERPHTQAAQVMSGAYSQQQQQQQLDESAYSQSSSHQAVVLATGNCANSYYPTTAVRQPGAPVVLHHGCNSPLPHYHNRQPLHYRVTQESCSSSVCSPAWSTQQQRDASQFETNAPTSVTPAAGIATQLVGVKQPCPDLHVLESTRVNFVEQDSTNPAAVVVDPANKQANGEATSGTPVATNDVTMQPPPLSMPPSDTGRQDNDESAVSSGSEASTTNVSSESEQHVANKIRLNEDDDDDAEEVSATAGSSATTLVQTTTAQAATGDTCEEEGQQQQQKQQQEKSELASSSLTSWRGESYRVPAVSDSEIEARIERLGFTDSERQLINEMLDATRLVFESSGYTNREELQNDSPLDDFVVFCDAALRRLIKTVKQIAAFRMLSMDDQILLLKNACFKILLLRSTFHYHDDLGGWLDKAGRLLIPLKSLKSEKSNNYERHKAIMDKLAMPLRKDRLLMSFMVLLILFDPNVSLKHINSVRLDNMIYLYTMRKYLVGSQPEPLAKYERLVETLQLINTCNEEYNLFFSRNYQPEEITPLLIEIFDISINDQM